LLAKTDKDSRDDFQKSFWPQGKLKMETELTNEQNLILHNSVNSVFDSALQLVTLSRSIFHL